MMKCLDSDITDNPDLAKKVDLPHISNVTDNLAKKFSHLKSNAADKDRSVKDRLFVSGATYFH